MRHPVKELGVLLRAAERRHWRVERASKYDKIYSACGDDRKTGHVSPSNPHYARRRRQLERATCWGDSHDLLPGLGSGVPR